MIMERDAIRISELDGTTVVKIGRTAKDITDRMKGYPKGSRVIAVACVANSVEAEKRLISLFDDKFTQEEDHGREYYSGDLRKMQKKFLKFSMTEVMFEEVEEESESEETHVERNTDNKQEINSIYNKICPTCNIRIVNLYNHSGCILPLLIRYTEHFDRYINNFNILNTKYDELKVNYHNQCIYSTECTFRRLENTTNFKKILNMKPCEEIPIDAIREMENGDDTSFKSWLKDHNLKNI